MVCCGHLLQHGWEEKKRSRTKIVNNFVKKLKIRDDEK